ncbi:unnamed protein product [Mytilus edulis]|uniref:Uncharacterized protein n=1 Tax=Mytilus edulis TaxID=6550 RepID=A0A8S3SNA0_MYTED|nr:unnamed protein product [Mytilus edulis]
MNDRQTGINFTYIQNIKLKYKEQHKRLRRQPKIVRHLYMIAIHIFKAEIRLSPALKIRCESLEALKLTTECECYGYLDLAEFILGKTDNVCDQHFHPMNAAASSGFCDLLELISRGAEVNHRDEGVHTPMTTACINKHEAAVKFLIDKEADINKRTKKGPTPLMWACTSGNKQLASLLIYHGADINKCDYEEQTAIMQSRKHSAHEMSDF